MSRSPGQSRSVRRRRFLRTIAAGGALLGGATRVGGAERPAPPRNHHGSMTATGIATIGWDHPADPCAGSLDRFEIRSGGEVVTRVPVGITSASVDLSAVEDGWAVVAVDHHGRESEPARSDPDPFPHGDELIIEPAERANIIDGDRSIGTEEWARFDVELVPSPIGRVELPPHFQYEITVGLSTPCAA